MKNLLLLNNSLNYVIINPSCVFTCNVEVNSMSFYNTNRYIFLNSQTTHELGKYYFFNFHEKHHDVNVKLDCPDI